MNEVMKMNMTPDFAIDLFISSFLAWTIIFALILGD